GGIIPMSNSANRSGIVTVDEFSNGGRLQLFHLFVEHMPRMFGFSIGKGIRHRPVGLGANLDRWKREPLLDPSEIAFMSSNTGLASDVGGMAMMLEASRETRTAETQGEIR
ncbi:MAG: hypothetical protein Q8O63_07990, partial [Hoeflea sp.]|nr:hypothetical protein [Hoeflea sp.]